MRSRHSWVAWPLLIVSSCWAVACGGQNELGHVKANLRGDMRFADFSRARFDADMDTACGPGGILPERDEDLPRWPYVQKVTSNSAEVLFTTRLEGAFRLVAKTPEGVTLAEVDATPDPDTRPSVGTQYIASLDGLPPAATICYELTTNGEPLSVPAGFRTAPDPALPSTARFVALGDLGTRTSDQFAVLEQLRKVPMDFMLVTGDVAYTSGTPEQLEHNFFGVYRDVLQKVPVFPASGNHDYNTADARPFRDAFSLFTNGGAAGYERWYSFDWGPVHVVVLDTEKLGKSQLEWLEADLDAHDRPWTVAVAHRPPFSSGSHGSDVKTRKLLAPIFRAHKVPLVLTGHEHQYERTIPMDGVVYVVTGGGGRGTRGVGMSEFTAASDRVAHFVWLEANAKMLRMVAVDATGQAFDSVQFDREPVAVVNAP